MPKVLATDLDGTLMYPAHLFRCIPRKNVVFLRKWIDAGNKLVLITSRGPEYMDRLRKEIQRDFDYVTYTSSYIVANGEVIRDVSIDAKTMTDITDRIYHEYHPMAYLMNTKDSPLLIKNLSGVGTLLICMYWFYWLFQGKRREKYILSNKVFDEYLKNGNVYKVMVFFGLARSKNEIAKKLNKEFRNQYPEIESSWSHVVNEITPKNCNKGEGLKYYCDHLGINNEDVYVVGDSGNDISMFKLFYENSFCMAKAYPSVKKHAKHVISRVYHLDEIVNGKEKTK